MVQTRSALLLLALAGFAAQAEAATLEEILAKNYQAHGGLDRIKSVRTMKMIGSSSFGGVDAPLTIYFKRPGMFRVEATVQGKVFITAHDGAIGWNINPFMGTSDAVKLPDRDANELKEQGDIDGPLVDAKEKGYTVELLGEDDLEGTKVYKLKITNKRQETTTMYLDKESCIELKQIAVRTSEGTEVTTETIYSDYKTVDGLMIAHSLETRTNGQPSGQISFRTIEVNKDLENAMFLMPTRESAAAQTAAEKAPAETKAKEAKTKETKAKGKKGKGKK